LGNSLSDSPLLQASGLSKSFGGKTVLKNFDFDLKAGEVHGLLGQNGSGKSTFIKLLSGFHTPDPGGSLQIRGKSIRLPMGLSAPHTLGLAFVHQDLGLSESMTVVENLRIGRYQTQFGWRIPWRKESARVNQELRRVGLKFSSGTTVSELRPVERALVAILRALDQIRGRREAGVLILDEPTSYLPRDGVDLLFLAIRDVAAQGHGVILVTHRLEEVRAITERVTILRDGVRIDTANTDSLSDSDLVQRILGRALSELYPSMPDASAEVAMSIRNLSGEGLQPFSLDVRHGEVVGLTGLLGMGHEQIPYLLFGAEPATGGTISVSGREYSLAGLTPAKAIAAGIVLLPGNRLRQGAVLTATVKENVTLPTLNRYFKHGVINLRAEHRRTKSLLKSFHVRPPEPDRLMATLSGGNQQKALVAKWFEVAPRVLLLHEPTQGVDVGARREIFRLLRQAAESGWTVLVASSEYEDLAHLCDRVVVFRHGKPRSQLTGSDLTVERIVEQCLATQVTTAP